MLAAQAVADQTWKGPAMSATGFSSFDTTVEKTNHILHEIEPAYGWPKDRRIQSYAALRTILHALRDRLTVQVTAQPTSCRLWSEASTTTAGIPVRYR